MSSPKSALTGFAIDTHVRLIVRSRRRLLGLTQADLAMRLGVAVAELKAYECGKTSLTPHMIWLMTQALSCTPTDLFAGLPDLAFSPKDDD